VSKGIGEKRGGESLKNNKRGYRKPSLAQRRGNSSTLSLQDGKTERKWGWVKRRKSRRTFLNVGNGEEQGKEYEGAS